MNAHGGKERRWMPSKRGKEERKYFATREEGKLPEAVTSACISWRSIGTISKVGFAVALDSRERSQSCETCKHKKKVQGCRRTRKREEGCIAAKRRWRRGKARRYAQKRDPSIVRPSTIRRCSGFPNRDWNLDSKSLAKRLRYSHEIHTLARTISGAVRIVVFDEESGYLRNERLGQSVEKSFIYVLEDGRRQLPFDTHPVVFVAKQSSRACASDEGIVQAFQRQECRDRRIRNRIEKDYGLENGLLAPLTAATCREAACAKECHYSFRRIIYGIRERKERRTRDRIEDLTRR